ncbi:DUF2946 domain-containing protein [Ideonella sp. BN130291]|uniref:DUF2946 domain-containing protein n=1 Tax=Ideonella sp. BN130291 TaxID=3112940 RepID=UPI002E2627F9|nr:DUF2946 domain-containing protein [Ideonella sp. BN130291]
MLFSRRHLRSFTRLALLAMLAFALVPGLSRVLSHARGVSAGWAEICSAQGVPRAVQADASLPEPASSGAGHLDHCPMCSVTSHAAGLPPAPLSVAAPAVREGRPRLFYAAPRPLFAWLAAQPRAPPLIVA